MLKYSSALALTLKTKSTKPDWASALVTELGSSLRIRCFRDSNANAANPASTGVEFLNCAMVGPLSYDPTTGVVSGFGALSNVTIQQSADLTTGTSILRIEGNGKYVQGSLGLVGSNKDFKFTANPSATGGVAVSAATAINPPSKLPSAQQGGGGSNPVPTPVGNTIATIRVDNTGSSSITTDFIPPMFGHPFKMGDIPTGYYPMFELESGTNVPFTMFNESRWPDGSLQFASFLVRVPSAVAPSGNVNVRIKATTTAPGVSSRSLADFSSGGADLQVAVTGLDNLSGEWVSRLNQGITDADDITVYGDGPVGKVWKVRQQFMQGGSNHGQLECYWYIAALQNASGGLYGLRYLGKITQPWYNVDSPAKDFRSFSVALLKNGTSTVRDLVATLGAPKTVKYPTTLETIPVTNPDTGSPVRINWMEQLSVAGLEDQTLVRLSGSTLPTGTSATTSYFVNITAHDKKHVGLYTDTNLGSANQVSLSGTASADLAMIAYPFITHFGSMYTAGTSAKWDYAQAGGSVAVDAQVRIVHDSAYWQRTGVVPAYATTTVTAQTDNGGYVLNSMKPIERATGTTGERADIGLLPDWSAKHLISQREVDEKIVRSTGLMNAHASIALYDSATRSIRPANNTSYTGMPAPHPGFTWNGDPLVTNGFTNPPGSLSTGLKGMQFDHMPSLSAYPYMVTGEPQFLDSLIDMANMTVISGYSGITVATPHDASAQRNITIAGTTYYGAVGFHSQIRAAAWALREVAYAAALTPDNHKCKPYIKDIHNTSYTAMKAFHDSLATDFWKSSGMLSYWANTAQSGWMVGYFGQALAQAYRMHRDPNILFMLNHVAKWWDTIYTAHGGWHVSAFKYSTRTSASFGGQLVTSMDQVCYAGYPTSWSAATNRITIAPGPDGYAPQNGDAVLWDLNSNGEGSGEGAAPAGIPPATVHYLINKSGDTFQLSATKNGAPITFADTRGSNAFVRMANPPTDKTMGGRLETAGYAANIRGMLRLAKLAGATVSDGLLTELNSKLSATDFSYEPRYDLADTI